MIRILLRLPKNLDTRFSDSNVLVFFDNFRVNAPFDDSMTSFDEQD